MFWAIFNTILSKIANAFYVKTTKYDIPAILNELYAHFWTIIWLIWIIIAWKFNIILFSWVDYVLTFTSIWIYFIRAVVDKTVYANEKISSLIPFQNLWKIMSVFLWIIVLWEETSWISIALFLLAVIIIFVTSIDLKSLKFSKYVTYYIFTRFLVSIDDIIVGYLLINNSSLDCFSSYMVFIIMVMFLVSLFKGYFVYNKVLDYKYFGYSIVSSLWWVCWLITVLMIKEMWLSLSVILSFLWIWVSLIMSYIMFWDKPSKKNLISTFFVTIIIVLAFIYS